LLWVLAAPLAACPVDDDDDFGEEPEVETLPPHFEEATEELGIDFEFLAPPEHPFLYPTIKYGGGSALADLDRDGLPELLVTSVFGQAALFDNVDGSFAEVDSSVAGVDEAVGVTVADLDDDGLLDLLITSDVRVLPFLNQGGLQFAEQPTLYETPEGVRPTTTTVADADGDGDLDVYVSTWGVSDDMFMNPAHGFDCLLVGLGGLEFEGCAPGLPHVGGLTDIVGFEDVDRDGDLDILAVKDFGPEMVPNALFIHEGDLQYVERAAEWGIDIRVYAMGLDFADVDGDGYLEFVIGDTEERVQLWSLRDGVGVDVGPAWGAHAEDDDRHLASWGAIFEDVDFDGTPEVLTPWGLKEYWIGPSDQYNTLWTFDGERLQDLSDEALPAIPSPTWRTVLTGDIDGDGALDLVWTSQVGPLSVQLGRPSGNRWLAVELELGSTLGALVDVDGTQRRITGGGRGLISSVGPVAWFGLGQRAAAERVRVTWPDGTVTELTDVEADQRIVVAP